MSKSGVGDGLRNRGLLIDNKSLGLLDSLDILRLIELGLELRLLNKIVLGFGFRDIGRLNIGDGSDKRDQSKERSESEKDSCDDEYSGPRVLRGDRVNGEVGVDVSERDGVSIVVEVGVDVFKECGT